MPKGIAEIALDPKDPKGCAKSLVSEVIMPLFFRLHEDVGCEAAGAFLLELNQGLADVLWDHNSPFDTLALLNHFKKKLGTRNSAGVLLH